MRESDESNPMKPPVSVNDLSASAGERCCTAVGGCIGCNKFQFFKWKKSQ
jgi:hypothetical protein